MSRGSRRRPLNPMHCPRWEPSPPLPADSNSGSESHLSGLLRWLRHTNLKFGMPRTILHCRTWLACIDAWSLQLLLSTAKAVRLLPCLLTTHPKVLAGMS